MASSPADTVFGVQFSVYITGVYMPATSVSVTTAFSVVPQCTIALPAEPKLYGIGRDDLIPVHVFFLDNFSDTPGTYRLFFEGVITGFAYMNNAMGRSFVVQCEGTLNILNKIYIRHIASLSDVFTASLPAQAFTEFTKVVIPSIFPLLLFTKDGAPATEDNLIAYPTQMVENAMKFIKEYAQDNPLAAFYKQYFIDIIADKRCQKVEFFDKEGADCVSFWKCDRFPTLAFLTNKATVDALITQVENWGQRASIFELISGVLDKMEYEFAFFNSPMLSSSKSVISMCVKPILYDAFPPVCNVMFRSLVASFSTNENVSDVPTRIRANDINSVLNIIAGDSSMDLQKMLTIDCYPSDKFGFDTLPDVDKDMYAQELLESETHTGPKIVDIAAPDWWSYINTARMSGSAEEQQTQFFTARMQMMKNMYLKKRYEGSRLSVNLAFNPYLVSGLPGVVFDPQDNAFGFIGQVLSVEHTLTKTGATTSVELGYVRSIDEEVANRLQNTLTFISEKVTDYLANSGEVLPMTQVYQSMIACDSVNSICELQTMIDEVEAWGDKQSNPAEAYKYNQRNIVTQKEFMEEFLGLTIGEGAEVKDEYGNLIPTVYNGKLVEDINTSAKGHHPDYRQILIDLQSTEVDQTIYGA